jgi:uncharacterized oligopeptide transporter (OPT) family protein
MKSTWLPKLGTPASYVLLTLVAIFILGPLGGVTAAYMNFSLGFFVGGQVLAGILGSVVTFGYGPNGKHGANYMQSMAAAVAGMAAMGVLIQAMVWLGMPEPSAWTLILYFLCIGMFGVGVGMLYTPILVDKLQLTYPSGLAVANILRALTDKAILRRSVSQLGGGMGAGFGVGFLAHKVAAIANLGFSAATFGGGMIVGARVTASAILMGGIGVLIEPWLRSTGLIGPEDPFRKIMFIFALGSILGAAIIDIGLLMRDFFRRERSPSTPQTADGRTTNVPRLLAWVLVWAIALVVVATQLLHLPVAWVVLAIALAFVFLLVNGISQGMTDQNPISAAFVVTVLVMGALGLKDPLVGLFAGSILLVSCTVGVDMQQDRSTGARLGSDRTIQFRFQVVGIIMGAVLAVAMTKLFLSSYPELRINAYDTPGAGGAWQSTMTYKFVGVLKTLTTSDPAKMQVMLLGGVFGVVVQIIRRVVLGSAAYKAWKARSTGTRVADFILDALVLASPYASSFGGFVDFMTSLWWGIGGILASVLGWAGARKKAQQATSADALPDDMSAVSLVGGGLIAGDALWALALALWGFATMAG